MTTTAPNALPPASTTAPAPASALRFITCGSVDDGKSTLIGRLLLDSHSVLQDHLASITPGGTSAGHSNNATNDPSTAASAPDLARLTDGLQAEREQGITIDVAWRYFSTPTRKFIIGDAPGHEQYTRNMVTAASQADAAIVLVDATKLDWADPQPALLAQTKRHTLLAHLLGVPSIVFAINKLDAVADPAAAHAHIRAALLAFAAAQGVRVCAIVPISALRGDNVVASSAGFANYTGPALLPLLHTLPSLADQRADDAPLAFPVQWVQPFANSADTSRSRRVLWGRVAAGSARAGQTLRTHPSGQAATIVEVLDHAQRPAEHIPTGRSAGIVLDRELDIARGDWLLAAIDPPPPAPTDSLDSFNGFDDPAALAPTHAWGPAQRQLVATIAWMDEDPAQAGRLYWALHGHRWVKARITRVIDQLDIHSLQRGAASQLAANAIGTVELALQEAIPTASYTQSRTLGAMILVNPSTHRTAAAVLLNASQ